jgi:hypothetical protein
MTDKPSGRFVAGWNMAGYLPETEPEVFDSLSDAAEYLRETMHRFADEDTDSGDSLTYPTLDVGDTWADGWYGELHFWAEPYTEQDED